MFDAIAPTYERVNTLASFGRDAVWRRRAVAAADVRPGDVVLDICCGTGDMLRTFATHAPQASRLIGVDFAAQMLARGNFNGHAVPIDVIRADALQLPLADASADVITCAFGVRNFHDLQAGLNEMARVARPGAHVVILEFVTPANALLRWAHTFYSRTILRGVAALVSRDRSGAYDYLPRSIQTFDTAESMLRRLSTAGFADTTVRTMNLGGVAIYRGTRTPLPDREGSGESRAAANQESQQLPGKDR